jgi:hypothetical protein
MSGSLGLQVGKIDALLWYYLVYRAIRVSRRLWTENRSFLIMMLTFILPTIGMYATSFANVGLLARQRLVVVLGVAVMAAIHSPRMQARAPAPAEAEAL